MTTAVSNTSGTSAASATAAHKSWSNMGAGDFMKLLTAQLKNQDPTAPVDNAQMVAQLAQFSSLSAANTTNTQLQTISDQIGKLGGTAA
jgi:flagellar basal-body rod modification protein FlgD